MPNSSPAWVSQVQVVVTVDNEPVAPETTTEYLIFKLDRYSGVEQTYQTIVTHTVTAGRIFVFTAVEMESDDYAHTHFKLEIGGAVTFEDKIFETAYSPPIPAMRYAAGIVITLSCKSTDGSPINVDGDIIGKELG